VAMELGSLPLYTGVAPAANIVAIKVCNETGGSLGWIAVERDRFVTGPCERGLR
jgi:hypothetical protein